MDNELKNFLEENALGHLFQSMFDEGATLELLLQCTDSELCLFTKKVVDKIKLRIALDELRGRHNNDTEENGNISLPIHERECWEATSVANVKEKPPHITTTYIVTNDQQSKKTEASDTLPVQQTVFHQLFTESDTTSSGTVSADILSPETETSLSTHEELASNDALTDILPEAADEWTLTLNKSDVDFLSSLSSNTLVGKESSRCLRQLLTSVSIGKVLLNKADNKESLNSRDRSLLVKIIVETELHALDVTNKSIRKNVWQQWANEVVHLFKDEKAAVYYVPYHVIDGKIIQANGLIHNRLITHRRYLNSLNQTKKRSSSSCSSDSSDSGAGSSKSEENRKRLRPLPENFKVSHSSAVESDLEWLKSSSSPDKLLQEKWKTTLQLRQALIAKSTCKEYFSTFPGLVLPSGYKLLSSDFEAVYPNASTIFAEKFPLVKTKLLTLLIEKGDSIRPDPQTLDLLNLATEGEEQANLAAFLSIPYLLRQMPTISVPRKKVWKLSREEVRSAFIARVATPADIERHCADREALLVGKGIPEQPYIIAVGASWSTVRQYEIVIFKGMRYQQPNICAAINTAYQIYWALDCAYSKDSAPCWMLVQRTMFDMKSKFDTEGVPLRELLSKVGF